jgi:hypothetical protein
MGEMCWRISFTENAAWLEDIGEVCDFVGADGGDDVAHPGGGKPSREKHHQVLVRMCWRRWARVVSLSRVGIAHNVNKNDRSCYG